MWFSPLESGNSLAAYFLFLHAGLVILVGLALAIPAALGKKEFFKSYSDRSNDKYEPLTNDGEEILRIVEMETGSHNLFWGLCTLGALLGGGAQLLCLLQLPAMASLVFYFSRVNKTLYMAASAIVLTVCGYFGLQPWPPASISVEWSPTAIFLAAHSAMLLVIGIVFLAGKTEGIYESQPLSKKFMSREFEILVATQLLGGGLGAVGAVCTNGAVNFCIVVAPAFLVIGVVHWIGIGDKNGAMSNFVVMALYGCAGLLPQVL